MNEASVSAPLMKGLREALPGAIVIKHADRSMIGMPDCSVTWGGRTLFLEFKLFEWRPWMGLADNCSVSNTLMRLLAEAKKKAPAQWALMDSLNKASRSRYVIWVKKTCVYISDPQADFGTVYAPDKTSGAVAVLADMMREWCRTGN